MNRDSVLPVLDNTGRRHWICRGQVIRIQLGAASSQLAVIVDPRPRGAGRIRIRRYSARARRFRSANRIPLELVLEYTPAVPDPVRVLARQASQ